MYLVFSFKKIGTQVKTQNQAGLSMSQRKTSQPVQSPSFKRKSTFRQVVENQKDEFLTTYGIHFDIPSTQIAEVAIYPKDPSIVILFVNYYNGEKEGKTDREFFAERSEKDQDTDDMKEESSFQEESSIDKIEAKSLGIDRKQRVSAIIFLKETESTYKIFEEKLFDQKLSGPAVFSQDGSLFVFSMQDDFTIVNSSTIDQLTKFEQISKIPRSPLSDLIRIKFSPTNEYLVLIYSKRFEIFDLAISPKDINKEKKVLCMENIDYIINVEFKSDGSKSGYVATKAITQGNVHSNIRILQFNNDKIIIQGMTTIKIKDYGLSTKFILEFSPNLDKAYISNVVASTEIQSKSQQAFIYDFEAKYKFIVPPIKQVRQVSVLNDSASGSELGPFISLNANPMDRECTLVIDDNKRINLEHAYNYQNTQIITFDSRIVGNQIQIRVAFLRDSEQLCFFKYTEDVEQGRSRQPTPHIEGLPQEEKQVPTLQYKEFQEYPIHNFFFPYVTYTDLRGSINVLCLDNSSERFIISLPKVKKWQRIQQVKVTANGELFFIAEDSKELKLYKFDLVKKMFINNGLPLMKLDKSQIDKGNCISDFWVYIEEVQSTKRIMFKAAQTSYNVAFYFVTYPSRTMYIMTSIQNKITIKQISLKVSSIVTKRNQMHYIMSGKLIESLNWHKLSLESEIVYKETEGQILQIIPCNNLKKMWMFTQTEGKYFLKEIKLTSDQRFVAILSKTEVTDAALVNNILQRKNYGFIEESLNYNSKIFLSRESVFPLDKIQKRKEASLRFNDILGLLSYENVMNDYPQVHPQSQKILYMIKVDQDMKRGIVMPSLISDNKIKFKSDDGQEFLNEKVLYTMLALPKASYNKSQIESGSQSLQLTLPQSPVKQGTAIFIFNIDKNTYKLVDARGKHLCSGNFKKVLTEMDGKIVAISDNGKMLLAFNESCNLGTIFELSFIFQEQEISVQLQRKLTIQLPEQTQSTGDLTDRFTSTLKKQSFLGERKDAQKDFKINNNADVLLITSGNDQVSSSFYLYTFDKMATNDKLLMSSDPEAMILNFDIGEDHKFQEAKLSDQNVITWTQAICRIYNLKTNEYTTLSLALERLDILSIQEIIQVTSEEGEQKFIYRIQNSQTTQMIVLWNETKQSEECSVDVFESAKILLDENQNVYILDNESGLINLNDDAGGCKNIAFRYQVQKQLSADKAKQELQQKKNNSQQSIEQIGQTVKRVIYQERKEYQEFNQKQNDGFNLMTQEQEQVQYQEISYLQYILYNKHIILPYSFYQLIVQEHIRKVVTERISSTNEGIQDFVNLLQTIPLSILSYQMQNKTILHQFATSFKELNVLLNTFKKLDPNLIDMLMIQNERQETPLQLAIKSKNPRCINLIMNMMAIGCSETFGKHTNLLSKHFDDLASYTAFKDFMDAALYQSEQYQQITQLAVRDEQELEETGIIREHFTVVADSLFNQKFIDLKSRNERNVNVNALRVDWILKTQEGEKLLVKISESDDMGIYNIQAIQIIISYLWGIYKSRIIIFSFLPFIIYFFHFNICITSLYQDVEPETFSDRVQFFFLFPFIAYFMTIEFRQLYYQGFKYFLDMWNLIDIMTVFSACIVTVYMILYSSEEDDGFVGIFGAFTVITLYLKLFYFLRIFDATNSFIRMIVQMTFDIRFFIFILVIAIVGFGNGFFILSQQNYKEDQFVHSFVDGILFTYRMTLGDFDSEHFGKVNKWAVLLVFFFSTLLIMIILLNLLIAIMGDTFSKVKETEQQSKMKEHLQLILDNRFLVDTKTRFKNVKYIVSVTLEDEKQDDQEQEQQKQIVLEEQIINIQQKLDNMQSQQEDFQALVLKEFKKVNQEKEAQHAVSLMKHVSEKSKAPLKKQFFKLKK